MKRLPILIAFLLGSLSYAQADIFDDFRSHWLKEDYAKLGTLLNKTMDYELDGESSRISKDQVLAKLMDMKANCNNASFEAGHKGSGGGNQFAILNLNCGSKSYRITMYAKKLGESLLIASLRIENI